MEPFTDKTRFDGFGRLDSGMSSAVLPQLLAKDQAAWLVNATVRGGFMQNRSVFMNRALDFGGDPVLQANFNGGLWKGTVVYNADDGVISHAVAIGGRIFLLTETTSGTWTVKDISIPNDLNPAITPDNQVWMWQAENYLIIQDGVSIPLFFDGTVMRRSNPNPGDGYKGTVSSNTAGAGGFVVPQIGSSTGADTVLLTPALPASAKANATILNVGQLGTYLVTEIGGGGTTVNLQNITGTFGAFVPNGTGVSWLNTAPELPAGRMGAYGLGRNWMSLIDGQQFIASDLVGGSSGTQALGYRDAVLKVTENSYLAGGGAFRIPGGGDRITAMIFQSNLDASLGTGPLQVYTPVRVFSCQAPTDRTTWRSLTNPILTEALTSDGALSQNSTIAVNSDTIFRGTQGYRSLILARRDFDTWGNTPISAEMDRVLNLDAENLLRFSSAILFDNRVLMTASPSSGDFGTTHTDIIALDLNPVSTLRGKEPSVYDGNWTGLNVLQLTQGRFAQSQRAFAFITGLTGIELVEILTTGTGVNDNDQSPIPMAIESAQLFQERDPTMRKLKRLLDGEIWVAEIIGKVWFTVFYRPDFDACWHVWHRWLVCSDTSGAPQWRPRMGFGQPPTEVCDPASNPNNTPPQESFSFQVRVEIVGHAKIMGVFCAANEIPMKTFQPPICVPDSCFTVLQ